MDTVKRSELARRLGEGGMNRCSTEDFQGNEAVLLYTIMVDI